jgi:hypothetical protein
MEDTQLGMDIEKPKFEKLYSFKRRIEIEEEAFTTTPLKNTATFWFTFFVSLSHSSQYSFKYLVNGIYYQKIFRYSFLK